MVSAKLKAIFPREHGAWAVLYGSLLLGWIASDRLRLELLLLALAATAWFFANEPLTRIVKYGQKAPSRLEWQRWHLWGLVYTGVALSLSAVLVFGYGLWLLVPLGVLMGLLLALRLYGVSRRNEMSLLQEQLSTTGLTLAGPAAYYVARHSVDGAALVVWVISILFFSSGLFYVRMLLSRVKRTANRSRRLWACCLYHTGLVAILLLMVQTGTITVWLLVAFAPLIIRAFWGMIFPPSGPPNLKRVGRLEVAYSIFFVALFAVGWRG
jgi:hypothetical protein